jgi:hypothetical protein
MTVCQVDFEDRFINWDELRPSLYVDGTDIKVNEQCPLQRQDYSHKFRHAGLRFEVATALGCSRIVHWAGGVPCGAWPDIKLAQEHLVPKLREGEQAAGDRGYRKENNCGPFFAPRRDDGSEVVKHHNQILKRMGARHETVNKRLKDYNILKIGFRGQRDRLVEAFGACINLVQLKIYEDEPLFDL